jgi:hypothetical protein
MLISRSLSVEMMDLRIKEERLGVQNALKLHPPFLLATSFVYMITALRGQQFF